MTQKTLVDLVEVLLAEKRTWNVDTNLKIVIGGTEIGNIAVTSGHRKNDCKIVHKVLITHLQYS